MKLDYRDIEDYDLVFISKVFSKTAVPDEVLTKPNVKYGGTGFFYSDAPLLPPEIEHIKPDYHLYDDWIKGRIDNGANPSEFTYYTDYSIGFLTRGCFRKCAYCVNKDKIASVRHSNILEFTDENRKKLCFLDDNFFACKDWRSIIEEVKSCGKKFQFKQGLDERLLNEEKIHELAAWNYDGAYIFAFDDIDDKEIIEGKLQQIYTLYPSFKKNLRFYVLCGFDRNEKWDLNFWLKDIEDTFKRCFILAKYSALPYIMRYEKCYDSEFSGLYSTIASWANQPNIFKKFDFATYSMCRGMSNENYKKYKRDIRSYLKEIGKKGASWRYMEDILIRYPQIANKYFYTTPDSLLMYGNGKIYKAS